MDAYFSMVRDEERRADAERDAAWARWEAAAMAKAEREVVDSRLYQDANGELTELGEAWVEAKWQEAERAVDATSEADESDWLYVGQVEVKLDRPRSAAELEALREMAAEEGREADESRLRFLEERCGSWMDRSEAETPLAQAELAAFDPASVQPEDGTLYIPF